MGFGASIACATAPVEEPVGTIDSDQPPPSSGRRSASPPADFAAATPDDAIAIVGSIVTGTGEPVAGTAFTTVDRNGESWDGISEADGSLRVEGLHPPYDLRVGDTAWLGVSRRDPRVEVSADERTAAPITIALGVLAPPGAVLVDVVSSSARGTGSASVVATPNADGDGVAVVTLAHEFRARATSDVLLHVLVHDAGFAVVGYARVLVPLADVGNTEVDAGSVRPFLVATTEPLALDANVEVTLDVPGAAGVPGASFALPSFELGARRGLRLPRIDGATWRMKASATAPPTLLSLHRSSQAWSGSLPIGHDPLALPLPVGPEITRPLAGGALSARGAGLSWNDDPGALFTADVIDEARGVFRYRIVGVATDLPFRRIENLGFPRLRPGPHTLSLTTAPFASVDDAVSPDPLARTRRFDERRSGGATYETVPFTVTP